MTTHNGEKLNHEILMENNRLRFIIKRFRDKVPKIDLDKKNKIDSNPSSGIRMELIA